MKTNVVELADSIRARATAPLIVCECPDHTSHDNAAWLWVFHEKQILWRGAIDTYHLPPSKRFRLVWTLPPAPCRIYTRRGLRCEVEPSRVRLREGAAPMGMGVAPEESEVGLKLRAEDQVILLSARTHLPANLEDRLLHLLRENLDWTYIGEKSQVHHVFPLLYNTLKRFDQWTPSKVLSGLRSATLQNGVRNVLAREELLRILRRLQEHGIPAMPLKGPMLAESVYGHLSLRVFGDLDILVSPDQILKAKAALMSLGYQPLLSLSHAEERLYLRADCEYHLSRLAPGGGFSVVELHWNLLTPSFAVPLDAGLLWRSASEVIVEGVRYARMSPENQFLAVCLHAWKHFWRPLQCVCDLNEFLGRAQDRLDWSEIRARTQALRIEKIIATSLEVVRILFEREALPAISTGASSDLPSQLLPEQVTASIFPNDEDPASILRVHRFYASFRSSRLDRLRYCWRVLATPTTTDFRELSLPERLSTLYWLLRPFRLLWKILCGRQRLKQEPAIQHQSKGKKFR